MKLVTPLLTSYLLATGLGTLLVIGAPWLLAYLALLIFPYLILIYTPTAFAYGCLFGVIRLCLTVLPIWRSRPTRHSLITYSAGLLTLGAVLSGSAFSYFEGAARVAPYRLENVGSGRVELYGDIRLQLGPVIDCGRECTTLLQYANVDSVTMTSTKAGDFASFRDGEIASPSLESTFHWADNPYCRGHADENSAETIGRCLTGGPKPQTYSFELRQSAWTEWERFSPASNRSLRGPVQVRLAEIRKANQIIARKSLTDIWVLTTPPIFAPSCGPVYQEKFCWARHLMGRAYYEDDPSILDLLQLRQLR